MCFSDQSNMSSRLLLPMRMSESRMLKDNRAIRGWKRRSVFSTNCEGYDMKERGLDMEDD